MPAPMMSTSHLQQRGARLRSGSWPGRLAAGSAAQPAGHARQSRARAGPEQGQSRARTGPEQGQSRARAGPEQGAHCLISLLTTTSAAAGVFITTAGSVLSASSVPLTVRLDGGSAGGGTATSTVEPSLSTLTTIFCLGGGGDLGGLLEGGGFLLMTVTMSCGSLVPARAGCASRQSSSTPQASSGAALLARCCGCMGVRVRWGSGTLRQGGQPRRLRAHGRPRGPARPVGEGGAKARPVDVVDLCAPGAQRGRRRRASDHIKARPVRRRPTHRASRAVRPAGWRTAVVVCRARCFAAAPLPRWR
jgi:hypothetical protein